MVVLEGPTSGPEIKADKIRVDVTADWPASYQQQLEVVFCLTLSASHCCGGILAHSSLHLCSCSALRGPVNTWTTSGNLFSVFIGYIWTQFRPSFSCRWTPEPFGPKPSTLHRRAKWAVSADLFQTCRLASWVNNMLTEVWWVVNLISKNWDISKGFQTNATCWP